MYSPTPQEFGRFQSETTSRPRIVLFGTPQFAATSFSALIETLSFDIPLIVTQPDRLVGRGLEVKFSPVKSLALDNDIPVLQPTSLKGSTENSKAFLEKLNQLAPIDLFIVIAYGKIIPKALLDIPSVFPQRPAQYLSPLQAA